MKKFLLVVSLFTGTWCGAQTIFMENIAVEYEKVVYARQMIKEMWGAEAFERWGSNVPATITYYYDFGGNTKRSVYKPGREAPDAANGWWNNFFGSKNIVEIDYPAKRIKALKPVFEENFFLEDSLLNIEWKLTADTRIIAGFECRKAVGILNDTIGIFAFYSDEILVSGGPESIQGLPGLILGMGIPRLHATWFATKVTISESTPPAPVIPKRAKKITYEKLITDVHRALKEWGAEGGKMLINFVI